MKAIMFLCHTTLIQLWKGTAILIHPSHQHLFHLTREQLSLMTFRKLILKLNKAHWPSLCDSLMIMLTSRPSPVPSSKPLLHLSQP